MGMFDTIICEERPPEWPETARLNDFQTKDFDCCLDTYTITKDGRLMHHYREWESTPEEEKPYPHATDWRTACGSIRVRKDSERLVDTNFHGKLRFYDTIGSNAEGNYEWFEYIAKFTDGTLVEIKRVQEDQDE